jgi:D-arabinose 1-dehydrogenase-like Zn-dependent alcohol dehydrogenase
VIATGAGPGDLVAVLGIGGLGHLGVQFAAKMGCRTVAITRAAKAYERMMSGAGRFRMVPTMGS